MSRARTWTPTRTKTPTPMWTPTRTPTSTPTPIDLTGSWVGSFIYPGCRDPWVFMTIGQTGDFVDGIFTTSCFPNTFLEITGTLQGNTLVVSLWYGDFLLGVLTGPASTTAIGVWNPGHAIGLPLTR